MLEHHSQSNGYISGGCNLQNTPLVINSAICAILVELLGICIILSSYSSKLQERKVGFVLLLTMLLLLLFATGMFLSRQETSTQQLSFKVPLLPWLPIVALFFNIFLILELSQLTWIRFGAWMGIGRLTRVFLFLQGLRLGFNRRNVTPSLYISLFSHPLYHRLK